LSSSDAQEPAVKGTPSWMLAFVAVIVFTVAMMLVSFPVGLYTVFGGDLSQNYTASSAVSGLNLYLIFTTVRIGVSGTLGELFVALSAVYLCFFVLAAKQGAGLLASLRRSSRGSYDALFSNPLVAVVVILGAVSFVTLLIDRLQTSAGVATGSLTGDPFALLVDFTLAPLFEETSFRLIMIGLPVLVLGLLVVRDFRSLNPARVLWRPSSLWDVDEEGEPPRRFEDASPSMFPDRPHDSLKVRAMKPVVYTFLLVSSLYFGYAHYGSGGGWGPGKITEAAFAGLALGYLYIKYGFQANVLLHWSVNYVGGVFSFLGQALYGIPWTSNSGNYLDVVPTLDIVFILGIPAAYILAVELLGRRRAERTTAFSSA
jgi:hypothetical protein